MKSHFLLVLAAFVALISSPAFAAEENGEAGGSMHTDILHGPGYYVTGAGGWSWLSFDSSKHYDYTVPDLPSYHDIGILDFDFDNSWTISGAIGTRLFYDLLREGDDLRGEVEVSYARYDLSAITETGGDGVVTYDHVPLADVSGDVKATTVFGNLWYDLNIDSPVAPYAGGGLGVAFVKYSAIGTVAEGQPHQMGRNDSETDFAYQLGLGVRAPLGDSVSVDVGYRWRSILMSGNANLNSNNLLIGLSLHF